MEALATEVMGEDHGDDVGFQYMFNHLPVGRQRTLGYHAMLLGLIHRAAKKGDLATVRYLSMSGLAMSEQFAYDENWISAWKIFGHQQPPWSTWNQADINPMKKENAHARLVDAKWVAAAVGAFKDEEVLRKKRGKGGAKGKDAKEKDGE